MQIWQICGWSHVSSSVPRSRRNQTQHRNDTIAAAANLQAEYAEWLDALPECRVATGL